ncbi:MAG: hypothetical protein K8S54_04225 [Spirochaetia bacterium]|nr:hypothetical protein [Spirochaetia bacterium]
MAILPFQVGGQMDMLSFTEQDLPDLLARATHFIFSSTRDHRLIEPAAVEKAAKRAGWSSDQPLNSIAMKSLCRETNASKLFAGSAQFLAGDRITLSATVLSCVTGKELSRANRAGSISGLQQLMRGLIQDAAPFAPPRDRQGPGRLRAADIVLVIDASGSMEEDYRAIVKSLRGIQESVPAKSRIGAVVVQPGGLDILPLTEAWDKTIKILESKNPAGEVSLKQIEDAIGVVENLRDWKGDRKVLLAFDAKNQAKRMSGLESRLRRLTARSVDLNLFQLQGQDIKDQNEIRRLTNVLRISNPGVVYARRAGFAEGFSIYLVQYGARFYRADRDVSEEIARGTIKPEELLPIETIHYPAEDLNLKNLPALYARRENLRLIGTSPILSGLESRIKRATEVRGEEMPALYKVLVKHEGKGFWLRLGGAAAAAQLQKSKGQSTYIGLSFRRNGNDLENDPSVAFPMQQAQVPRLLIATRENLLRMRNLTVDDVYFLFCEIVEVQSGQPEDLRR